MPELPDQWSSAGSAPAGDFFGFAEASSPDDVVYVVSHMSGIFRSANGGVTWESSQTETSHIAGQIAISPDDSDVAVTTSGALFKTTNGGLSWLTTGVGQEGGTSGKIRGLLYRNGYLLLLDSDGVIYQSQDDGETVEAVGQIPVAENGFPLPPHDDEGAFYLDESWWKLGKSRFAVWAAQHQGGLWVTSGDLNAWTLVDPGPFHLNTFGADTNGAWIGGYDRLLLATRNEMVELDGRGLDVSVMSRTAGGSILFGDGTTVVRRAVDGSIAFAELPDEVHELRGVLSRDNGDVLLAGQDGVYVSFDDGQSFVESTDGLLVDDLGPLLTHPDCPSWVWSGTVCERGLFASRDWASSELTRVDHYFHYVMEGRVSPSAPRDIWFTTDDRVYLSRDVGETWTRLAPDELNVHLHGLAVHPLEPAVALVGSVGSGTSQDDRARVYRTEDFGETWQDVSEGLPDSPASVHTLHYIDHNPEVVLLGSFPGGDFTHSTGGPGFGIYRSENAGQSWSLVEGTGTANVADFAQCGSRVYAATDAGVLLSDTSGESWERGLSTGLEFRSVACFQETVIAIDTMGIWRSDDGGRAWQQWSGGLDMEGVNLRALSQVAFSGDGAVVYAAIPRRGLLRRAR